MTLPLRNHRLKQSLAEEWTADGCVVARRMPLEFRAEAGGAATCRGVRCGVRGGPGFRWAGLVGKGRSEQLPAPRIWAGSALSCGTKRLGCASPGPAFLPFDHRSHGLLSSIRSTGAFRLSAASPFDHRSHGLLASNRATGAICPLGRLEATQPSPPRPVRRRRPGPCRRAGGWRRR